MVFPESIKYYEEHKEEIMAYYKETHPRKNTKKEYIEWLENKLCELPHYMQDEFEKQSEELDKFVIWAVEHIGKLNIPTSQIPGFETAYDLWRDYRCRENSPK